MAICLHNANKNKVGDCIKPIKDSGKRQVFETGSRRDTREGKGRWDLLPFYGLREVAQHYEGGSVKYGDRNWEKGQPLSRYIDSAIRHLMKTMANLQDENHAAAAAWNILCFIETKKRIELGVLPKELDDMPDYGDEYANGIEGE